MMTAFEALAEPRRRQILDLLRERERPVGELVQFLAVSQPAVSKHLRVLRDVGLVEARVAAQQRLYRLQAAPLREIDDWMAPYRASWSTSLDALEAHLDEAGQIGTHAPRPTSQRRTSPQRTRSPVT